MLELVARADEVQGWLRKLADQAPVFFPERVGHRSFRFERVTASSAVDLEAYVPTIVPPGKKLAPARDELIRFGVGAGGKLEIQGTVDKSSRILAGVQSCDLKAIWLLDKVHGSGMRDPHYLSRRESTAIIAFDCQQPCDDRAFCQATKSLGHREGADVFLTGTAGEWLVESLSARGDELVRDAPFRRCTDAAARRAKAAGKRPEAFGRQLRAAVDKMPALLRSQYKANVWGHHVEKCFSCGTCTLVCPTCYCFDVQDELGFDLQSGSRVRTWDSCMLPQFATVAGGHNFRPEAAARQRHRVKRKFEYLMERFGGDSFCVGCGRCGRQCTSHIDIYDIANDIAQAGGA